MASITRAVGPNVPNPVRQEVLLVQQLLNRHRQPPLLPIAESGVADGETFAAIAEFQGRVVKMHSPDGRVDPGGATIRALSTGVADAREETVGLDPVGPQTAIGGMVHFATTQAHERSKGTCSRYVANAINAGLPEGSRRLAVVHSPMVLSPEHDTQGLGPANGGRMGPKLREVGFQSIKTVQSAEFDAATALEVGDVIVLRTVNRTSGAEMPGHVAIWTGTNWISDFKQPGGRNPNVYRHSTTNRVTGYELFRYVGH